MDLLSFMARDAITCAASVVSLWLFVIVVDEASAAFKRVFKKK